MSEMRFTPVARGLLTLMPALNDLLPSRSEGQTASARYCYTLWMRHLTLLHAHGFRGTPDTVAELGPGETLGVGLCALLSGSDHLVGLDVVAHSDLGKNQKSLNELVTLFRERASALRKGWPDFSQYLDERHFPGQILTDELLGQTLRPERIDAIHHALAFPSAANSITVDYKAPWTDPRVIEAGSVDLIISASVLEHVVDLPATYRALYQWLRPGGWMSHQSRSQVSRADTQMERLSRLFRRHVEAGRRATAVHDQSPAGIGSPATDAGSGISIAHAAETRAQRRYPSRGTRAPLGGYIGRRSQLLRPVRHCDEVSLPSGA